AKVTVSLSGASDCDCDIRAEEIEINGSGASDFEGRVTAACLKLDLSGDSDAEIEGEVGKLLLDLSGASDIESPVVNRRYGLVCNSCEGSLSGSSDAYLHCDGIISVSLSGSSDLHYTGDATTSDCSTSGGSSIQHDRL
ncbi:MAG: GIN domain-containing protein, partial [Bacteroidales bacterium]